MTTETISTEIPNPPLKLRPKGREFWDEIFALLSAGGGLDRVDLYLLARYCDALAEWGELNEWSQSNEPFEKLISSKGVEYFAKHPKVSRLETLDPHILRMERALGIGSRSRIAGGGGKPTAPALDSWLKGTVGRDT